MPWCYVITSLFPFKVRKSYINSTQNTLTATSFLNSKSLYFLLRSWIVFIFSPHFSHETSLTYPVNSRLAESLPLAGGTGSWSRIQALRRPHQTARSFLRDVLKIYLFGYYFIFTICVKLKENKTNFLKGHVSRKKNEGGGKSAAIFRRSLSTING